MGAVLPADRVSQALAVVRAWRADTDSPCDCPVCAARGLVIVDRSARPFAEWYALTCPACGLDATINVPMSGPVSFGD